MLYKNEYSLACNAAVKTKDFLKENFEMDAKLISNSEKDIKTFADLESEKLIISILQRTDITIISEESSIKNVKELPKCEPYWLVDPIDGTLNFSRKIPISSISISLWCENKPIFGIVQPLTNEPMYRGIVNEGAWYGDKEIKVSKVAKKQDAILATGFPSNRSYEKSSLIKSLENIRSFKKVRMIGCASLSLCYVACGKFDFYEEDDIHWWDVAAGFAIVKSAGGYFVAEKGSNWHQINAKATNGLINI